MRVIPLLIEISTALLFVAILVCGLGAAALFQWGRRL